MGSNRAKQIANVLNGAERPKYINLKPPPIGCVALEIEGTAPLLQNNFAQKSIEEMLRKHMGLTVQREKKRPREVIEAAKILNVDGQVCVPPAAIKLAMLTASMQFKTLKKTQLRVAFLVEGGSIPIQYRECIPQMDIVRVGNGVPDVRFRPAFYDWKAQVVLQFGELLAIETVIELLQRAGSVGLCEWRPEKNGSNGTFKVTRPILDDDELEEVRRRCAPPLVRPRIPEWALDMEVDAMVLSNAFSGAVQEEEQRRRPPNDVPPPASDVVKTKSPTKRKAES